MKAVTQYLDFFRSERQRLEAGSLPLLNAQREAAAAALERLQFPSQKVERYKYTDVEAAFAPNYGIELTPQKPADTTEKHSLEPEKHSPATVSPSHPEALSHYATLADVNADAITALNTMLVQDVTVIYAAPGERKEHPVQITRTLQATAQLMQNRRLLIVAEAGAELTVILTDKAVAGQDFLTTQVTEVFVGEGAHVELYDIEDTQERCHRFHQVFAQVTAGGHLTHGVFTLAGGVSRNQTDIRLTGEGAAVQLLGCAVLGGTQHADNNTLIDHLAPGCTSHELYKYVVDQQATGAFAGRVLVREGAVQTDSVERNANLVCTSQARMWTQPMLEIYADDVKCSHGSTVGQLNDDALFYMRQRGISETEARTLLKQAFASEVLNEIPHEALRQRLHVLVEKRFRSCENCQLCK